MSRISQQFNDLINLKKIALKDTWFKSKATSPTSSSDVAQSELVQCITKARNALMALQNKDGHWCFPLEADCTIPAEYILMMHFMDEIDVELEQKLAIFIREQQSEVHGGWALYYGGEFDLSCSVKSYFALKIVGDSPDAPHMQRVRTAIQASRRRFFMQS
ncbi:MAG TPA: prenyltransferase/squalene oxidase repeat-containing protein, partial [Nitrosomonas sp.]|nr:prenyltransferase/squalene oxidase repeat-containing protein [Nitrosomonas sp.]